MSILKLVLKIEEMKFEDIDLADLPRTNAKNVYDMANNARKNLDRLIAGIKNLI